MPADHPAKESEVHPHKGGEAAGRVIGGGLGVVLAFVLILLMLGPVLWAPTWAGLRVARLVVGSWQPWAAGLAAALAVLLIQVGLLIQKSPVLRYPIVAVLAFAWVGGLWLEFTSPPHDWVTTAPTLHTPGTWSWVLIGVGTVVYAGIYLLSLSRFGKGRWARRWQLIK
jgi:hypothetical protein